VKPAHGTRQRLGKGRWGVFSGEGRCARKRIIAAILVAIVMFSPSPMARAQANPPSEYGLKAAFLFNFAKFVEWPQGNSQSFFSVCILGKDPFGPLLDHALSNKRIADRPVVIERLKDKSEARGCQMVFVSSQESTPLAEILENLRGANVLLVGETNGFASSGGTIEFTLDEDNQVRFTINTDAVSRAGLTFSSNLLALAKIVHDQRHSKGG